MDVLAILLWNPAVWTLKYSKTVHMHLWISNTLRPLDHDWFIDSKNKKPFEFQVYEALKSTLPLELWSPTAENKESYQKLQLSTLGKKWSFFCNKTDDNQGTLSFFKGICIIACSSIYLLGTIKKKKRIIDGHPQCYYWSSFFFFFLQSSTP